MKSYSISDHLFKQCKLYINKQMIYKRINTSMKMGKLRVNDGVLSDNDHI